MDNNELAGYLLLVGVVVFFVVLTLTCIDFEKVCNPYSTDSICFNSNLRCEVECGNYDWNSNGVVAGTCKCDCGEYFVSFCSGVAWKKE